MIKIYSENMNRKRREYIRKKRIKGEFKRNKMSRRKKRMRGRIEMR